MAGNVSGLHLFGPDTGPEALSLLDGNYGALTTALNTLSNFTNNYLDSGAVNALVVTVPSPQVFSYSDGIILQVKVAATNTTTTPTINVNGLGLKTIVNADGSALAAGQLVLGSWATLQYNSTGGVFMLIGGAGFAFPKLVVGPPSSGNALAVNGAVAGGNGIFIAAGVASSDASLVILNQAQTRTLTEIFADGHFFLGFNGSGVTLSANAAGNVTINAPSSGPALTATAASGQAAAQFNGVDIVQIITNSAAVTNQSSIQFQQASVAKGFIGADGSQNLVAGSTNGDFVIRAAAGAGAGTLRFVTAAAGASTQMLINGTGNVTTNAPSSGSTLTLNGAANTAALTVLANTTSGQAFGALVRGGSTSADYALAVTNAAATINYFQVRGDGSILGGGPVNGGLVDMTPDVSSWTATFSGAISTTGTVKWRRVGPLVCLYTDAAVTATSSSSTTISFNLLPASITPANSRFVPVLIVNSGVSTIGSAQVTSSNTVTLSAGAQPGTNFNNAATCGLGGGACMYYTL